MFLLTVGSFISAFTFVICTFTALYFAIIGNIGTSLGYALFASVWFVLMVVFGYAYVSRR